MYSNPQQFLHQQRPPHKFNSEFMKDLEKNYFIITKSTLNKHLNPDLKKKTENHKSLKSIFSENITYFLENTSIHGLRYTGQRDIFYLERAYFAIAIVIVFSAASYLIGDIYDKWDTKPVILSMKPITPSIFEFPFPAITICNMNQAMQSEAVHIKNGSNEELVLKNLCNRNISKELLSYPENVTNQKIYYKEFITKFQQPCNRMLLKCEYGGKDSDCNSIFKTTLTDEGLCCTFNAIHPSFLFLDESTVYISDSFREIQDIPILWTEENGYPENLPLHYYPRKAKGKGIYQGLKVYLDAETYNYHCSSTNGAGFKIRIHSPAQIPQVKEIGVNIPTGSRTRISISASQYAATENVRNKNIEYRQCLFQDENKLTEFKLYSRQSCQLECIAKIVYQNCGCIRYYMPLVVQNATGCTIKDFKCFSSIENSGTEKGKCDESCLPRCNYIYYDYNQYNLKFHETSFIMADQNMVELMKKYPFSYIKNSVSSIFFYYEDNALVRTVVQDQYVGFINFLGMFGGLLGLFIGISFGSVYETTFFIFVRPMYLIYRHLRKADKVKN